MNPYLSVEGAAAHIGVSIRTIYRMEKTKEITLLKLGRRTVVRRAEADRFLNTPTPRLMRRAEG